MVFYLKINRNENYTYRNLQKWINIANVNTNNEVYIICDNIVVKEKALNKIDFHELKVEWIESIFDNTDVNDIVDNAIIECWKKAAYAHFTTFVHAKERGYEEFWNIDADDTFICLSEERAYELLESAKKYSCTNDIDLFSLDMWRTREVGLWWTFGITYTNMKINWIDIIKKYCNSDMDRIKKMMRLCCNLDNLFGCIGQIADEVKIDTFYFENLRFIHYSDDFFRRPIDSGLFMWKEGKLIFPLLRALGNEKVGVVDIYEDIKKLDIGITDEESYLSMINNGFNKKRISWTERMIDDRKGGMSGEDIKDDIVCNYYI